MNDVSYGSPRPESVQYLGETLAAQQALGPAATEDLARTFLARMQREIDEQVDQRVQQALTTMKPPKAWKKQQDPKELALGSMGIAIPLSAIAAFSSAGFAGLLVVWIGLVVINVVWARNS